MIIIFALLIGRFSLFFVPGHKFCFSVLYNQLSVTSSVFFISGTVYFSSDWFFITVLVYLKFSLNFSVLPSLLRILMTITFNSVSSSYLFLFHGEGRVLDLISIVISFETYFSVSSFLF